MSELVEPTADVLEICRKLLLTEAYAGKARKPSTKDSLKKILSALIAAHAAGVPFDTMAELLSHAGLKVTSDTLRSYYFVLRKEFEVAASAKKHAGAMASFDNKLHKKLTDEGLKLAHPKFALTDPAPRQKIKTTANKVSKPEETQPTQTKGEELSPSIASPSLSISQPSAIELNSAIADKKSLQNKPPRPIAPISIDKNAAETLDEIDVLSREKEIDDAFEHLPLVEDVVLRDGRVYLASGQPFVGTLAKRQVLILKRNEKLIAPSPSRTSKDFVTTPRVL